MSNLGLAAWLSINAVPTMICPIMNTSTQKLPLLRTPVFETNDDCSTGLPCAGAKARLKPDSLWASGGTTEVMPSLETPEVFLPLRFFTTAGGGCATFFILDRFSA